MISIILDKQNNRIIVKFIGKVIRVIGKSKPLLVQLSLLDKKHQLNNIFYVPTINQAMQSDS